MNDLNLVGGTSKSSRDHDLATRPDEKRQCGAWTIVVDIRNVDIEKIDIVFRGDDPVLCP